MAKSGIGAVAVAATIAVSLFNCQTTRRIHVRANIHVAGRIIELVQESILENIHFVDVELIPQAGSVVRNVADFEGVVG